MLSINESKYQKEPDSELIRRIIQGEKQLYSIIIKKYNQRLYRTGIAILNDDIEVEDAMQVTYINAYTGLGGFGYKSSFSTWITKIMANECFHRLKQRSRFLTTSNELLENKNDSSVLKSHRTPFTSAVNSELREILDNAIKHLPEMYRSVFVLRIIENMDVAETKECLNISESNVKVRLNRAKAMLKEYLSSYYSNDEILHFHLNRCDKISKLVMSKIETNFSSDTNLQDSSFLL